MILQSLFCHTFAYAITANSIWLSLLVPPLAQCCCFLLNITACAAALIGGCTVRRERKRPLQQLHSKRGVGLFSRVGLFSGDYGTHQQQTNKQTNKITKQQNIGTFSLSNIVQNNSAILLRECGHCPTAPSMLPSLLLLLLLEILDKELDLLDQSLSHSRRLWQARSNTHTWNTKTRKK